MTSAQQRAAAIAPARCGAPLIAPPASPGASRRLLGASALWGFAESTLFFIVSDVLVTAATVRRGLRTGLAASVAAAAPDTVRAVLAALPGITPASIDDTFAAYAEGGLAALAAGGFTGVPFKIYAAAAGEAEVALLPFMAVAFAARLARFAAAAFAVALLRRLAPVPDRAATALLAVFWLGFYAWCFSIAG